MRDERRRWRERETDVSLLFRMEDADCRIAFLTEASTPCYAFQPRIFRYRIVKLEHSWNAKIFSLCLSKECQPEGKGTYRDTHQDGGKKRSWDIIIVLDSVVSAEYKVNRIIFSLYSFQLVFTVSFQAGRPEMKDTSKNVEWKREARNLSESNAEANKIHPPSKDLRW